METAFVTETQTIGEKYIGMAARAMDRYEREMAGKPSDATWTCLSLARLCLERARMSGADVSGEMRRFVSYGRDV